ncbi:MAG: ATP-binding protein [Thermodesulfovibrio sp.]|nr:ATP-binding protein [Thermodesulfovibrio sp.]MDW7997986.1 ATP-binding protein [Thermodesulfovibrio sp.]
MFIPNIFGTLMKITENPDTRYEFEIWFDYTKKAINLIREGTMVVVPNFASNNMETHLSILEIVSILPMHYALGSDISGYPGFIVEAAHSACLDWEQENESTEDTTKIRCIAVPTNFELKLTNDETTFQIEENIPMIGAKVNLLNNEYTQRVINLGINPEVENTLIIGNLVRDPEINILLRIEDLIKVHFGVFGFTGAGKSNFMSTLISKILENTKEPVKIILFDLMGEYTALLIDQLLKIPKAKIICLEEKTLPDIVFKCLNNEIKLTRQIAEIYQKTTLLPKMLKRRQNDFIKPLGLLIYHKKIKLWQELLDLTVDQAVQKGNPWGKRQKGSSHWNNINNIIGQVFGKYKDQDEKLTSDLAQKLLQNLEKTEKFNQYREDFSNLINVLKSVILTSNKDIKCGITTNEIISELNDKTSSSLYIINSHNPDILREFAHRLGNELYDNRRMTGEITPLCLFVFDEADEFIPQQPKGSYELSSSIAMTIARRGRKFGLGLGIATQRVRYLDTSIMAQPHTYFISKLPRQTDREVVAQAFGISEDIFKQTFKFKKGDWLLVSYDATGLDAIPIPIHTENADDRINKFLDEINKNK